MTRKYCSEGMYVERRKNTVFHNYISKDGCDVILRGPTILLGAKTISNHSTKYFTSKGLPILLSFCSIMCQVPQIPMLG